MKTELSKSSQYYISKERRLELMHFCKQYPEWVNNRVHMLFQVGYNYADQSGVHQAKAKDATFKAASDVIYLSFCIDAVDKAAKDTDPVLGDYIFQAAIRGLSYDKLSAYTQIPCCRNEFYELYRKFFWLLDKRLRYDLTQQA